ncbi:hypothetical protein pEaSNUABM42_00057 [Erwinia phage pEa_SNUABM_42]|nr:hypothetical protein pEaSNUABM43_00057 [Erwinia phage pEa_SNUABM_43]QVW55374.1 hypothetical protein pEaSNUABM42_00057 [Erwinia phage pEa_SNUABM_42]
MTDLYEDYADTLGLVRQEGRLAPVLDLVSLAIEYGYDTTLMDIYTGQIPDMNEECLRLEALINRCACALAQRLGVGLNPQVAYRKPKEVVRILHGLTSAFEEFEDTDTLYGILLSGEPPAYILENMVRYVYGDNDIHFEDLVVVVEPRVMNVMRNFLAATSAEQQAEGTDNPRMQRVVQFLRVYPQNPSAYVFLNLSDTTDINSVVSALDFSDEGGVGESELLTIYAVGLSIIENETFDEAYAALEGMLELINSDEAPEEPILRDGLAGLKTIYGVEEQTDEPD